MAGQDDGMYSLHGAGYWLDDVEEEVVEDEYAGDEYYADYEEDYYGYGDYFDAGAEIMGWLEEGHLFGDEVGAVYEPSAYCIVDEEL